MKLCKVSMRIIFKSICVQFNDKYSWNHLCNHLITKHHHSISMSVPYRPICAKLGVNDDMTYCRKTGILDILKTETKQGKIELSHCARWYHHIELKRFAQNDGHIFKSYIIRTSLYMYQHFIKSNIVNVKYDFFP